MKSVHEIKNILQSHKQELNRQYGVTGIGIFGSYVRNEQGSGSDLDVLIEFEKAIDLLTFVSLKNHLSDITGVPVDLVMKKALKPGIGKIIAQELVTI